jgi:hypothetical protein
LQDQVMPFMEPMVIISMTDDPRATSDRQARYRVGSESAGGDGEKMVKFQFRAAPEYRSAAAGSPADASTSAAPKLETPGLSAPNHLSQDKVWNRGDRSGLRTDSELDRNCFLDCFRRPFCPKSAPKPSPVSS